MMREHVLYDFNSTFVKFCVGAPKIVYLGEGPMCFGKRMCILLLFNAMLYKCQLENQQRYRISEQPASLAGLLFLSVTGKGVETYRLSGGFFCCSFCIF